MRKVILAIVVIVLLIPTYRVSGHVVGAFTDFLMSANEDRAHERLLQELQETEKEISKLSNQNAELEKRYNLLESDMIETILFYDTVGINSYLELLFSSNDILELLTAKEIIERKLLEYVFALNYLYFSHRELINQQLALEGHAYLLEIIEKNLLKRKEMFRRQPFLEDEPSMLAEVLGMIWEQEAEFVDEMIEADLLAISDKPEQFFIVDEADRVITLNEQEFNEISELTYLFRSQHAHVHFSKGQADLILIGDVTIQDDDTIQLVFDTGFLNGFILSRRMIDEFNGLTIDLTGLGIKLTDATVNQSQYTIKIEY